MCYRRIRNIISEMREDTAVMLLLHLLLLGSDQEIYECQYVVIELRYKSRDQFVLYS